MLNSISTTDWTQFWLQNILVLFGVIVGGIFAFLSWKESQISSKISERSWKTAQFNNQIQTDVILINTRKEVRDLSIAIEKCSENKEIGMIEILSKYYKQAKEDMLNAYELSCGLYFSDGLDKERFRKLRKREIISLFESRNKDGRFSYSKLHETINPFTAIKKFYDEVKDSE